MNSDSLRMQEPVDPRESQRALALRLGTVGHHKKGDEVWVLNGAFWYVAVIERRLPGNVYAARFTVLPKGQSFVIVAAAVYGGPVEGWCD